MLFNKPKTAIVAGCGRLGATLAGSLCDKNFQVVAIDKDSANFHRLPDNFSGFRIEGDASQINILHRACIEEADMLIAATQSDTVNSLIAQIASRIYGVKHVYMRLSDVNKALLVDGYGIDVICPFSLCLREFEDLSDLKLEGVSAN